MGVFPHPTLHFSDGQRQLKPFQIRDTVFVRFHASHEWVTVEHTHTSNCVKGDDPSIGGTMTRMPLAQCPCDNARRLRHPHHPGVCFLNTRTSRHYPADCCRSRPFQEWHLQLVSWPFSRLCLSVCLPVSVV